jgi:adenylyltransferase/sulfurtransferase
MDFTEEQIERYSRHIILPEVGGKGQKKIRQAKVFIVGTGGLGSPCAYYLCAAGVGKLGLVDSDTVELSNLQRQILHSTQDVNKSKIDSALKRLQPLNPDVEIAGYKERLTSKNILDIIREYDIVVDGSDNFPTRYLVNDACVMANKPLVHGGVFRFDGQVFTIVPKKGPCYRCLFPEPPPPNVMPSCQEAGILGVVPGIIGLLQANEVVKFILGKGDLLVGRLLIFNALESRFRTVRIPKDEKCSVCSDSPTITKLIDYELFCGIAKTG